MNFSKIIFSLIVVLTSSLCNGLNAEAEDEYTESQLEMLKELIALDWKEPGTHKLHLSHSTLVVPEGYSAFLGEDAKKFYNLSGNFGLDNSIECVVVDEDFSNTIYFSYSNSGYVSIEDWKSLNPSQLLKEISKNTEKANIERKKKGHPELKVVGWVQEPSLDKHSNTVFWAIECISSEDQNPIVNSNAIRLGRKGFERVVWVTDKDFYTPFGGELDIMLRSHSYDPGYRYTDFSKGDKIAGYGIASLVAATVGGKVVKSGGILLGMKKLWGVIAAGFIALLSKVKNLFRRGKSE